MEVKRLVGLAYIVCGVIAFVIFDKFLLWVWPFIEEGLNWTIRRGTGAARNYVHNWAILGPVRLTSLVALVAAGGLTWRFYKPKEYRSFLSEVIVELKKVTWPDWNETRRSTLIVMVFTVVLASFLWISDKLWGYLTGLLLA